MSVTGAILAGVGAAGSLGGAAIASHGANAAAQTQSDAALQAANLQHQDAQSALDFNKLVYGNQQAELAPYLAAGKPGLANLLYLMGMLKPGGVTSGTATGGPNGVPNAAPNITAAGVPGGAAAAIDPGQSAAANRTGDLPQWKLDTLGGNFSPNDAALSTGSTTGVPGVPSTADALGDLSKYINTDLGGFGSLAAPFSEQFTPPTGLTEQNDPGFQARLQLGQEALDRSAAAKGNVLTGGNVKDENQFAQDYASNEYNNVFNRALTKYSTDYNVYKSNQSDLFNRLGALTGIGQTSTTALNAAGSSAAGNIGNILLTSGAQIGQDVNNAGAARASGYAANGNIWGGAISNSAGSLQNLLLLSKLMGGGGNPDFIGVTG